MKEWEAYKVDTGEIGGNWCKEFQEISHVTHINSALEIIVSGEIKPILIADKPVLFDNDIPAGWFSPKHWPDGYRHGNVKFTFSFNKLIENKKCYWAGVKQYKNINEDVEGELGPEHCHILIATENNKLPLYPYDSSVAKGPWWYDVTNKKHYVNNRYVLQFMMDKSVPLNDMANLDFVDHHPRMCSIHSKNTHRCKELGERAELAAALFLTRAIVSKTNLSRYTEYFDDPTGDIKKSLGEAFDRFIRKVSKGESISGLLSKSNPKSNAILRAVMSAFTFDNKDDFKTLVHSFESKTDFIDLAARMFSECVGLGNWEKLRDHYNRENGII